MWLVYLNIKIILKVSAIVYVSSSRIEPASFTLYTILEFKIFHINSKSIRKKDYHNVHNNKMNKKLLTLSGYLENLSLRLNGKTRNLFCSNWNLETDIIAACFLKIE